jgi:hypothetical protein
LRRRFGPGTWRANLAAMIPDPAGKLSQRR